MPFSPANDCDRWRLAVDDELDCDADLVGANHCDRWRLGVDDRRVARDCGVDLVVAIDGAQANGNANANARGADVPATACVR